ncbi:MAG: peptidoglycan -binding protein, partial [Shimia sp.]
MAALRGRGRVQTSIWPGFVDAMTGLLLVLMFVLTIFTVVQFVLRDEISRQSDGILELQAEVQQLASALGLSQERADDLAGQVATLSGSLDEASARETVQAALIASLTSERDALVAEGEAQAATIAGLNATLADREATLTAAQGEITEFEAQVASLLAAQALRDDQIAALTGERDELLSTEQALNAALAEARTEIDAGLEAARL